MKPNVTQYTYISGEYGTFQVLVFIVNSEYGMGTEFPNMPPLKVNIKYYCHFLISLLYSQITHSFRLMSVRMF